MINKGKDKLSYDRTIFNDNVNVLFVDEPISNSSDDFIDVSVPLETLEKAISYGASFIAINSSYGSGKSSICNLLAQKKTFKKCSTISLWDAIIDKCDVPGENYKKQSIGIIPEKNKNGFTNNETCQDEALSYYKSFLFKLSSDYHSVRYSRYVSSLLNKTTGFFSVYLKSFKVALLFYLLVFTCSLIGLSYGFDMISMEKICLINNSITTIISKDCLFYKIIKFIYIYHPLIRIIALISTFILVIILVFKCRVVYTSWKAERERLLTTEDIISLYSRIINDSVSKRDKRKNLIIIEDIDRNIDQNKDAVYDFIKSLSKLKKYSCKDEKITKKLNSIVFIFCIDESKLNTDNTEHEQLLKLFDYKLDLGKIHYDNFKGIMDKLLERFNLSANQMKDLGLLLNSCNNNIRLLKNELNDCFLKYNTLKERFPDSEIRLKGCVGYSYIKNNFPVDYYKMQNDDNVTNDIIRLIEMQHRIKTANSKERLSFLLSGYSNEFCNKIIEFVKSSIIDEDYRMYFFNYPCVEKCRNIYEHYFWKYITGENKLDVKKNKELNKTYIENVALEVRRINLQYPNDIIEDKQVIEILLKEDNIIQLKVLFDDCFSLSDSKKLSKLKRFLENEFTDPEAVNVIKKIILQLYNEKWKNEKIVDYKSLYAIRILLIKLYRDDILDFDILFNNQFDSIKLSEYMFLSNDINIMKLINLNKIDKDLEELFVKSYCNFNHEQKVQIITTWKNNVQSPRYFVDFIVKFLNDYNKYAPNTLKSLIYYKELLINNEVFIRYINNIVQDSNSSILQTINDYAIDFGYSEESLKIFKKFGLYLTPCIFYLNNCKFSELTSYDFSKEIKKMTELKYEYLSDKIKKFKRFLLEQESGYIYSFLFTDSNFKDKYDIEIDWNNVKNIDLLISINVNSLDTIENYIKNSNHITSKDILYKFVDNLTKNISYNQLEKYDLIGIIILKYSEYCREISEYSNVFEEIINNFTGEYQCKLCIDYQICIQRIILRYSSLMTSYSGLYKEKYVELINNVPMSMLNEIVIKSINGYYLLNKEIIEKLMMFKEYKTALGSSILSKNLFFVDKILELISFNDLIEVYKYNLHFKKFLLNRENFLDVIVKNNYLQSIDPKLICEAIINENFKRSLVEKYLNYLSNEIIKEILLNIKNISELKAKSLIDFLFYSVKIRTIMFETLSIKNYVYNILPKNYKGYFTTLYRKYKK